MGERIGGERSETLGGATDWDELGRAESLAEARERRSQEKLRDNSEEAREIIREGFKVA